MADKKNFIYEIQYTKAADKFFKVHENVRSEYEDAIKELLVGDHPEKVDVKRIKGKRNDYFRIRLRKAVLSLSFLLFSGKKISMVRSIV